MDTVFFLKNISSRLSTNGAIKLMDSEVDFIAKLFATYRKKRNANKQASKLFFRIANRIKRNVQFHLWRAEYHLLISLTRLLGSVSMVKKSESKKVVRFGWFKQLSTYLTIFMRGNELCYQ